MTPTLVRAEEDEAKFCFGLSCGVGQAQATHIQRECTTRSSAREMQTCGLTRWSDDAFRVGEFGKEGNRRKEGKRLGCEETLQGWKNLSCHLVQCFHFI